MKIWIVDFNTYKLQIDPTLLSIRKKYFKLKNTVRNKWFGNLNVPTQNTFSVGVLRICTLLNYNGFECKYINSDSIFELIMKQDLPDVIGFSAVCPNIPKCADLATTIKSKNQHVRIVLGGAHALVASEQTRRKYTCFDDIIPYEDIKAAGFILKSAGYEFFRFKEPPNYNDYSLLPYPLEYYDINLFTSIGCNNQCIYCQDNKRTPYFNALDGGLKEIMQFCRERTNIHFFDSNFAYNITRLNLVSCALSELSHNFLLSCDMRPDYITPYVVNELVKAGISEIRIGLDTSDEHVLEFNKRGLNNSTIIKALKMIKDHSNIYVSTYSLTGLPGTTKETIKYNKDMFAYLLVSNMVQEIKNAIFVPYPNDKLNYEHQGVIIRDNNWANYDRQSYPVYDLVNIKRPEIWDDYISISQYIVDLWMQVNQIESIDETTSYPEAFAKNYGI